MLISLIERALDEVPQDYYRIRTTYSEEGIVRERVFCYELYHRIRSLQNDDESKIIRIHGEIDKNSHAEFNEDDRKNPDFVFHKPGSMKENALVVEVKGNLHDRRGYPRVKNAVKDFDTLTLFCTSYEYHKGLWILYNYSVDDVINMFKRRYHTEDMIRHENVAQRITFIFKKSHCELGFKMTMQEFIARIRE